MGLNVINEIGLQSPAEKVELANCRNKRVITCYAELDALTAAVRIKILLIVGVQLSLVGLVDNEALTAEVICCEILTAELGDEPVNDAKANFGFTGQIGDDFADIGIGCIESLKAGDNKLGFAIDFRRFASLGIRNVGQGSLH